MTGDRYAPVVPVPVGSTAGTIDTFVTSGVGLHSV
jgi:hypothetical protein